MSMPPTWARRLENVEADIVCVGHSHLQFQLRADGVVVLNPGSVGQPRDGDPRAAYALFDPDTREIEFRRLAYDVKQTQCQMQEEDLPPSLVARLANGL